MKKTFILKPTTTLSTLTSTTDPRKPGHGVSKLHALDKLRDQKRQEWPISRSVWSASSLLALLGDSGELNPDA